MTKLPTFLPDDPQGTPSALLDDLEEPTVNIHQVAAVLRRSAWLVLVCAVVAGAAAALYVRRQPPVYQARATLRIQSREPNLPEIFRNMSAATEVSSEMAVLSSRTLVEDATRELALQVRLISPFGAARDIFLKDIKVAPSLTPGEYRLVRQPDGRFEVRSSKPGARISWGRPGDRLSLPGVSLLLADSAARLKELTIRVSSFPDAVLGAQGALAVSRVEREADLLSVSCKDQDPALAWQIPNVVVGHFMKRREESEKLQASSQVTFLRSQIDTLAVQLSQSEEELKRYRERARVVNPGEEASRQIDRLIELESGRSTLEAERSSLARLLSEVERQRSVSVPGQQSAYRRLLAYPSLLQSQAASQLMGALTQVEEQRVALLARRTERDPEVQRLTGRMAELEAGLGSMAATYLQGLTDQVNSRDSTIALFGRELRALPGKELQYARLERTPSVLKEMYTLLQTRLKEAEIAAAAKSLNVATVDPAIAPRGPISPRPRVFIIAALVGGILVGLSGGVVREFLDHTVRTRADVLAASGLPVLALIPHILRHRRKPALIASRHVPSRRRVSPPTPPPSPMTPPPRPQPPQRSYTFLPAIGAPPEPPQAPQISHQSSSPEPVNMSYQTGMTVSGLGSAIAEAYCILQTNVSFARPGHSVKSLVLTSALPGEGKTTTAVNLALALAERGLSVLVMDADMRRGQVHHLLGLRKAPGLCEVLQGTQTFEVACRMVQVGQARELAVLTAGDPAASPPALLESHRMGMLLDRVKETYDIVIIDSPPVNILTDAALLGRQVDGVVLVVRAGVTDATALRYAMRQLRHVRAPALGVVLNDVSIKGSGKYDGAYLYASYAPDATEGGDES